MSKSAAVQRISVQLLLAALVVAIASLGVSAWALVSSQSPSGVQASAPVQMGEAKARVCGAFDLVRTAVTLQTNTNLGNDSVAVQAVNANARLATLGGGLFLLSRLGSDVPIELAGAVTSFASDLEDIGISQLAGERVEDPAQMKRMNDAQSTATRIIELCK